MLKRLMLITTLGCTTVACLPPRTGVPQRSNSVACGVQRWWKLITPHVQPAAGSRPELMRVAEVQEARAILNLMTAGAVRYCQQFGEYPVSFDQVVRYSRTLERRARCAVADHPPADPWGTRYRYRLVDGTPRPSSAGPDREFGTQDDIGLPSEGDGESEPFDIQSVCGEPPTQP